MTNSVRSLEGKIAVVAGGTRGAGRGIAVALGAAGATVYVTGRSVRGQASDMNRKETIEDTVDIIHTNGGVGIPVRVDHTVESEVRELFERIRQEQQGRLDILVNDVWGGDPLCEWTKPFWEHSLSNGWLMQERAVHSHIITSYYAAPLMIANRTGLIIEITDGVDYSYRGQLYYNLAKTSVIHLAKGMAEDLRTHGVTAVALTPGFLRSEAMLDHFGVSEANWQDAAKIDPHFIASETPYYIGQAVVALASDPQVSEKTGGAFSTWGLSDEYGFKDADDSQPHWGRYFAEHFPS
ncbi:short-chain dehydrogenase [Paenibacillus selenitireducens]|uniref:Short-chain dehydrogenase n=1 Tax=Paenibacillus selenitireducens TaxID=1324314 RepID=A0A1T2X1Z0_9BACL|nr:SDR family oxidoreductase [Paenibacillus selenitireducens]OPA73879.1 short-chain dehydrogenase [Paenibacillus selenitireducens]